MVVLYALGAAMLAERIASREVRGLPWPVIGGLSGVMLNWAGLVYFVL